MEDLNFKSPSVCYTFSVFKVFPTMISFIYSPTTFHSFDRVVESSCLMPKVSMQTEQSNFLWAKND